MPMSTSTARRNNVAPMFMATAPVDRWAALYRRYLSFINKYLSNVGKSYPRLDLQRALSNPPPDDRVNGHGLNRGKAIRRHPVDRQRRTEFQRDDDRDDARHQNHDRPHLLRNIRIGRHHQRRRNAG